MNTEPIEQGQILQSDLSKLSKPKPPILYPSVEMKSVSPISNSKKFLNPANKKNYASVRKLNSSLASYGSCQVIPKFSPKMQVIQQPSLSNLQEKNCPSIPTPKMKHQKTEYQFETIESNNIDFSHSDVENSSSKLVSGDKNFVSEAYINDQDESSDNFNINYASNNLFKSNSINVKRKGISHSASFNLAQKHNADKFNKSYSFLKFPKKVSKLNLSNTLGNDNYENVNKISNKLTFSHGSIEDKIITIQFSSNWGNSKSIILSTIKVMDEKKKNIPIKTISSVPDLNNINLLEKFIDNKLVKDENDIIAIDYDSSMNEKFSLIVTIDKSSNPKFVRIWNPSLKDEKLLSASVKNATVYLNHTKVSEGEVPQNFGIDLEFKAEKSDNEEEQHSQSFLVDELFPACKPEEKIFDTFGIYPFIKPRTITIEVLSTYKKIPAEIEYVGLNGVDFYDGKGIKLTNLDFDSISVRNILISSYANPKVIVRDSMKSCTLDDQFFGNYQDQSLQSNLFESSDEQNRIKYTSSVNPIFIFTFCKPTTISMMRIWNFNSINEGLDNGIQKVIIRSNNKIVWTGKITKGSGLINGIEKSATNIWFTDAISIRDHILKDFSND